MKSWTLGSIRKIRNRSKLNPTARPEQQNETASLCSGCRKYPLFCPQITPHRRTILGFRIWLFPEESILRSYRFVYIWIHWAFRFFRFVYQTFEIRRIQIFQVTCLSNRLKSAITEISFDPSEYFYQSWSIDFSSSL